MKNYKKFISTALAILMIAGCGTLTFAKSYDDVGEDNTAQVEISILSDIGVIKGTGENEFSPDAPVTREQMATLLFRLMLGRDDAGRVNTTQFTDLYEPYYNGAISWANAAGYILGASNVKFNPKGGITKQDAMTMLVRALGQDSGNLNAGYPWSYINAAVKLGLDRGLEDIAYTKTLTRAEVAVVIFNALTSEYLVGRTTSGGNVYYESTSIIEEVFGYSMAEATLVATNDYTLTGDVVVKDGYVTLSATNGSETFTMTVPYSSMNLEGSANSNLGKVYSVIYRESSGKYEILSTVQSVSQKDYTSVTVNKKNNTIKIGDSSYTLVEEYSDKLSTNNNELILYAYGEDGELTVVQNATDLDGMLGFYRVSVMGNGDDVKHAIIRMFEMDILSVDDNKRVNIADNSYMSDLKVTNEHKAENGDYVLYYYNKNTSELEIAEVLEIMTGTVKRLTGTTVKIGDDTLTLGNADAGISAESIREKLTLGTTVSVAVHNNAVVAVLKNATVSNSSEYLIALSDAYRVYENGSFKYVMTSFVDGEEKNIYVTDLSAREGVVYRYTQNNNVYTLIEARTDDGIILTGKNEFVQNTNGLDEIAYIISSSDDTRIDMNGNTYYTLTGGSANAVASVAGLGSMKFVTDKNTVIIVNDNGSMIQRKGNYNSSVEINDGAQVVAVFDNEIGSVETLKYLYISDGSLGNYASDAGFVRVLSNNGLVYENNTAYTEYTVYSYEKGTITTMLSQNDELVVGSDYRCGNDGTVTGEEVDVTVSGFVVGYTSGTISVDGSTFAIDEDTKIIKITSDNKLTSLKVGDIYMNNIEFVEENGKIKLIILGDAPEFTVDFDAEESKIVLTADFDTSYFEDSSVKVTSLRRNAVQLTLGKTSAEFSSDDMIIISVDEAISMDSGNYTMEIRIGAKSFNISFTAE